MIFAKAGSHLPFLDGGSWNFMEKLTDRYTGHELWVLKNWGEAACVSAFNELEDFRLARLRARGGSAAQRYGKK